MEVLLGLSMVYLSQCLSTLGESIRPTHYSLGPEWIFLRFKGVDLTEDDGTEGREKTETQTLLPSDRP